MSNRRRRPRHTSDPTIPAPALPGSSHPVWLLGLEAMSLFEASRGAPCSATLCLLVMR